MGEEFRTKLGQDWIPKVQDFWSNLAKQTQQNFDQSVKAAATGLTDLVSTTTGGSGPAGGDASGGAASKRVAGGKDAGAAGSRDATATGASAAVENSTTGSEVGPGGAQVASQKADEDGRKGEGSKDQEAQQAQNNWLGNWAANLQQRMAAGKKAPSPSTATSSGGAAGEGSKKKASSPSAQRGSEGAFRDGAGAGGVQESAGEASEDAKSVGIPGGLGPMAQQKGIATTYSWSEMDEGEPSRGKGAGGTKQ